MPHHTLRMPAKTLLAGNKIDVPAACAIRFRPYCGGVVTQTRNVSEYMLVLALCLVNIAVTVIRENFPLVTKGMDACPV